MLLIPTKALANQSLQVQLANQSCTINIQQLAYGMFVDLYVDTTPIILGVLAHNLNRIVRSLYLGFIGDLTFFDTEGTSDPVYTSLGTRYQLIYLEAADLPAGQG